MTATTAVMKVVVFSIINIVIVVFFNPFFFELHMFVWIVYNSIIFINFLCTFFCFTDRDFFLIANEII